MRHFSLKNKRVLITGAGGGIGFAAAAAFAMEGAALALFANSSAETLKENVKTDERFLGSFVRIYKCDISDPGAVDAAAREAVSELGGIDILVNNAGISVFGLDQDLTPASWESLLGVNLSGTMYMTRALIPKLLSSGGRIINISSMWGISGASCEAAYSATKGGINAYTKALAKELAPSHVPVNAIAFGAVDTKMNSRLSYEERREFEESIPYGRMAAPEEAAEMIIITACAPSYMTGQIICFDGAYL